MAEKESILVDCRFMTQKCFGGIETYTFEVIQYLYQQNFKIIVLTSNVEAKEYFRHIGEVKTFQWPYRLNFIEKLSNPSFYKELECDIFYTPVWFPGYLGHKTFRRVAITIHDCIPLNYYPNLKYKYRYYSVAFLGTILSDVILTDSNFSKGEIIQNFPLSSKKIQSLSAPLPINKLAEFDDSVIIEKSLERKGYYLFVSALRPYKGFDRTIKATSVLKGQNLPLVIVGNPTTSYGFIQTESRNSGNILFVGHVSDAQLNSLYRNALALVFPSRYEGFGLPIIEAQYHGCPVIATHTASIPEVGGDSVLYVMPDKEEALIASLAEKMALIATDTELRKTLVQRGYENIQRFMPEKVLPKIADAILGNSKL